MPVVWIPALLRDLTGGAEKQMVPGETVQQAIDSLDERYPGVKARLCEAGRLRPNIAVVVNGQVSRQRLRHRRTAASEVHFVAAISGG